ncbi:MAG: SRPBCC domain-containing protein [Ilumatobacteraceae bacterium]|nr:SRPBCC domain-containing protein [Acidimicrobiales bacterium]MCB9393289.1 SRPBCC domain-containing protein [Acidimicrobiaceae bacterium]
MGARSYTVTRSIGAPAPTVWGLLTDASSYSRWNRAVISIEGPISMGNRIKLVSVADPKRTFKLKVTAMQAPTHMVWADGMPLGLFSGQRTYTITERGATHCEFTMTEEFSGPLAALITKAIPDLTPSFETFADGLKAEAEAITR